MSLSYPRNSPSSARAASYCARCKRGFKTEFAINEHRRDSRRHWACPTCDFDADGWDELLEHCRTTWCRSVCQGCDEGTGEHWAFESAEYWEHVIDWNVCTECEEHFETLRALHSHGRYEHSVSGVSGYKASSPADWRSEEVEEDDQDEEEDGYEHECILCDRYFSTYSGMISHLESGSCNGVDRIHLAMLVADCNKWDEFMYGDCHEKILRRYKLDDPVGFYFCPTCETHMVELSSLFQHVESESCSQTLDDGSMGTLQRYLAAYL